MRFLQRHVQRHLVVEFERDDLAQALRRLDFGEAAVEGDAVLQVDDEVALDELGEVEQLVDLRRGRHRARVQTGATLPLAAEDLGLGDEHQAGGLDGGASWPGMANAESPASRLRPSSSRNLMRKPSLIGAAQETAAEGS